LALNFRQYCYEWKQGAAAKGSISKEDAARICVEALSVIPPTGLIFEVGF